MIRRIQIFVILLSAQRIAWAQTAAPTPIANEWQYGGFVDGAYLGDTNSPSNHLFRTRGTTPRVDELNVNMAAAYARKKPSESSRWGVEATGQLGEDSKIFGFSATAPNITGADWLLHLGPTNVSYLAPVGRGLTLQGGIFSSFVGYDSLYAKDNLNYTRPWTADFTPYLMLGVNASYPVTEKTTVTALLLNGYWHLAHANDVPSIGGQIAYKASDHVTLKETVLYGPHQENTSAGLWRFLSNTWVERRSARLVTALDFHVSEEAVDAPGRPRAWWVAAQAPIRWIVEGPWSVTARPEFAWDSIGRWTTVEQKIGAFTTTLEYKAALGKSQTILRFEHRYDRSSGPDGGFFKDIRPGLVGLTPNQHLFIVGAIVTFDGATKF